MKQDSNDSTSAVGAAERKNTQKVMYERMFKIDTKVRGRQIHFNLCHLCSIRQGRKYQKWRSNSSTLFRNA